MSGRIKDLLALLVDQWLDAANELWPADGPFAVDVHQSLIENEAKVLRLCAVQLRAAIRDL